MIFEGLTSATTGADPKDAPVSSQRSLDRGNVSDFYLRRVDIWPVDDIGLQKAVALHYQSGERPTPKQLRKVGERFAPWRTVATWYLWRSLDPVAVQY